MKKLRKEWQHRLDLDDWEILIQKTRREDMSDESNQGEAHYFFVAKQALITILDPIDYINKPFKQDIEQTIVHELLHLKFAILDTEDNTAWSNPLAHQLLNDMAKALVRAKRGSK